MDSFSPEYHKKRIEIEQIPASQLVNHVTEIYDNLRTSGEKRLFYGNNYGAVLKEDLLSKTSELRILAGDYRYTVKHNQEHNSSRFFAGYLDGVTLAFSAEDFNLIATQPKLSNLPTSQGLVKELRQFLFQYATAKPVDIETFKPSTKEQCESFATYLSEAEIIYKEEQIILRVIYEGLLETLRAEATETNLPSLQQVLTDMRKPPAPPKLPEELVYSTLVDIEITLKTEETVIAKLENDPSMTPETDQLIRDYFVYIYNQISGIEEKLNSPDSEDVINRLMKLEKYYERIVEARGRLHTGQFGDWFWNTSKVQDLAHVHYTLLYRFSQLSCHPQLAKAFGNA